jgi:hypothetical protein
LPAAHQGDTKGSVSSSTNLKPAIATIEKRGTQVPTPTESRSNLSLRVLVAVQVFVLLGSLLGSLFAPLTALAAGAFVKNLGTISNGGAVPSALTLTVTGSVSAGHSIIIGGSGTNVGGISSCADSKGNIYTVDKTQLNGSGGSVSICSTHNITAAKVLVSGVDTITVTWPSGGSGHAFSANEFSGLTAVPLDKTKGGTTNNSTPTSTSTTTTAQADEVLFGAIWWSGTNSATFTAPGSGACTGNPTGPYTLTNPAIETGKKLATEYRIATATGTYAACGTLSTGNQTASVIATYKIAAVTRTDTFTVHKAYVGTNGGSVSVSLSCSPNGGTVTPGSALAGDPAPNAVFTVTGASGDPTCTATEVIPSGYTATGAPAGTCSALLSAATCTITNTRDTGTILFTKVVSGGSAVAGDFTFTVNGTDYQSGDSDTFDTGSYTLTEGAVTGYTLTAASGACSLTGGVVTLTVTSAGGTCTITNTQNVAPSISFVKTVGTAVHGTGFFSTLVVVVPTGGVAAGHTIIIALKAGSTAGSIACSDTKLNTYSLDVQVGGGGIPRSAILSARVVVALVSGDQITCSFPTSSTGSAMSVNEFSGLAVAPLDKVASNAGTNSSPNSGLTATTTQANELVFGYVQSVAWTPATSGSSPLETYASAPNSFPYTQVGTLASGNVRPAYRIVSTTRQYQANGTGGGTGGWRSLIATYKGAP